MDQLKVTRREHPLRSYYEGTLESPTEFKKHLALGNHSQERVARQAHLPKHNAELLRISLLVLYIDLGDTAECWLGRMGNSMYSMGRDGPRRWADINHGRG